MVLRISHSIDLGTAHASCNLEPHRDWMQGDPDSRKHGIRVQKGDYVYHRKDSNRDNLDLRLTGPYIAADIREPNVTIDMGYRKTKVVHLNRCKVAPHGSESVATVPKAEVPFSHTDVVISIPRRTQQYRR